MVSRSVNFQGIGTYLLHYMRDMTLAFVPTYFWSNQNAKSLKDAFYYVDILEFYGYIFLNFIAF